MALSRPKPGFESPQGHFCSLGAAVLPDASGWLTAPPAITSAKLVIVCPFGACPGHAAFGPTATTPRAYLWGSLRISQDHVAGSSPNSRHLGGLLQVQPRASGEAIT